MPPFPFRLIPLREADQRRVIADFPGYPNGLQSVHTWGFKVAGTATEADMEALYNQPLSPADIWVCSPPKCGSMWTQEMVWLLENGLQYDTCSRMLTDRWLFTESRLAHDLHQRTKLWSESSQQTTGPAASSSSTTATSPAENANQPRFIKSHMPLSLLPPNLLDVCRLIYVARNPKDVCVSFYNHACRYKMINFQKDLNAFVDHFLDGTVIMTPVIPHMIEAWNLRHHPNMCFLFYEDLKRDLRGQIGKVSAFLGKQYSDHEISKLAEYLHIDNFKKNPWRSEDFGKKAGIVNEGKGEFIRCGKVGDWRNHMSEEVSKRFDLWIERELQGTDLRFTTELERQD